MSTILTVYRKATAVVVLGYLALILGMVLVYDTQPMNEAQRAGWAAVVVVCSAIPFEALSCRFRRLTAFLIAAYLATFIVGFLLLNIRLSIEWVILILIGCALISGKFIVFMKDWAVFIAVLVAWQVTDGLAGEFHFPWHVGEMIAVDKVIGFGNVPTVWLQAHFFDRSYINWLDILGVVVYSMHFILPVGAGFIIWLVNKRLYYRYAIAFSLAAIAGFATYVLFPAVPPWMAVKHCPNPANWNVCKAGMQHYLPWAHSRVPTYVLGAQMTHWLGPQFLINPIHTRWVPGVVDVWNFTMKGLVTKNHGNVVFGPLKFGFDDVGAIPSEHVMYPTLALLFFRRQFGRIGYLMVPYICLVIFCIVYMGQHYVVDGLVGIVYACTVYVLVMHLGPRPIGRFQWTQDAQQLSLKKPEEIPEGLVAAQSASGVGH